MIKPDKEKLELDDLKENYEKLRKKYSLPSFEELNQDFEIEKIDGKETDYLSREVRRTMIDKGIAYLRFIESFLNPGNAPLLFLALIKSIGETEKKNLEELYMRLGKFEIESIKLDNIYNETEDAEFIKKLYKEWQDVKEKFDQIICSFLEGLEKKSGKKDSCYLG